MNGRDDDGPVRFEAAEDALDGVRRALLHQLEAIELTLDGAIADVDNELLHDLRVAIRRTRAVLTQAKGVLPPDVRSKFRKRFGWLGRITGPPRDLDVQVSQWSSDVARLGPGDVALLEAVRTDLVGRRDAAHAQLSATLKGQDVADLLRDWREWLTDPAIRAEPSQPLGPFVAKRIRRAQRRVLSAGRAVSADSPSTQLHDLRKEAKQLRYLLECFATLFDDRARKAVVDHLKSLQDVLGKHQDSEVQLLQLRALARDLHDRAAVGNEVLLAMARLTSRLERRWRRQRSVCVGRFETYDTKANRRALVDLLRLVAGT